jgi:phosphate-selective porin OprO/OprP
MMRSLWRKTWRKLAAVAVAGVLAGATVDHVYSQDTSPDALLQRLERLEQQNRELQQKLQSVTTPVAADGGIDAKTVENIVSNYLQAQAKKEEAKKAEKKAEFVEVGSDLNFKTTFKDGISFATPDNAFKFHVGGRFHLDAGQFDQTDTFPNYDDAVNFRRLRMRADGTMWEIFDWVLEVDFANSSGNADRATFTDVYVDCTQLPWIGNLRVGRFKEPIGFEELISSRYINHIERSLAHAAFVPSRNLGVMAHRALGDDQRGTLMSGLFRDDTGEGIDPARGNGGFGAYEAEYAWTSRATFLPYWAHDGRCLVHLGGSYSFRNFHTNTETNTNRPRYRSGAEARLGTPTLIDTGAIEDVENVSLWGGEFAAQRGPLSVMSDVYVNQVNRQTRDGDPTSNPLYWGGYVQVGYFLTGEHRPYKRTSGTFDRVRPHGNFFLVKNEDGGISRGVGAWEVIARYSYLDLHSNGFSDDPSSSARTGGTGVLQGYTLGVNWYLNPNMKWMFNYVRTYRDSDAGPEFDGRVDCFLARLAIDF